MMISNTETTSEEATTVAPPAEVKSDVELAAESFSKMLPIFKKMVESLPSRKSFIRVINEIAEFPLAPKVPRLLSQQEKSVFYLFQELSQHKGLVLQSIMQEMHKSKDKVDESLS